MSTADNSVPASPGVGVDPRWIGTPVGSVPQGFVEMTPLRKPVDNTVDIA